MMVLHMSISQCFWCIIIFILKKFSIYFASLTNVSQWIWQVPVMLPGMVDGHSSQFLQRRQLYAGPMSKLRMLMICRMAKPEEVLIVEDENGNIVRETMKDNDVLVQYKVINWQLTNDICLLYVYGKYLDSHPKAIFLLVTCSCRWLIEDPVKFWETSMTAFWLLIIILLYRVWERLLSTCRILITRILKSRYVVLRGLALWMLWNIWIIWN